MLVIIIFLVAIIAEWIRNQFVATKIESDLIRNGKKVIIHDRSNETD